MASIHQPIELSSHIEPVPTAQGWGRSREQIHRDEKDLMAEHFAMHLYLTADDANPDARNRETAASIAVNPGTTPDRVVSASLSCMRDLWRRHGGFHITWYTGGAIVAATLKNFRENNPDYQSAAEAFLFPGHVDVGLESVSGRVPVEFINDHVAKHVFYYVLLSVHSFDINSGEAYFHFEREVELQRAIALLSAREKFLFLDSSKFERAGEPGYSVEMLLSNCGRVTIYTVTSTADERIIEGFGALSESLGMTSVNSSDWSAREAHSNAKELRLCIVGRNRSDRVFISREREAAASHRIA